MQQPIFTKDLLQEKLSIAFEAVKQKILSFDPKLRPTPEREGKWSALQNFKHLVLSNQAIASGLKGPKDRLKALGAPKNAAIGFDELEKMYKAGVRNVQGPAAFQPNIEADDTLDALLGRWQGIAEKFEERLKDWTEMELDEITFPHPLMGRLSARQMIYFAIFHTYHHLDIIDRIGKTLKND